MRLLATTLGVPPSAIRVVAGAAGRRKVIDIEGIGAEALRSRWPDLDV